MSLLRTSQCLTELTSRNCALDAFNKQKKAFCKYQHWTIKEAEQSIEERGAEMPRSLSVELVSMEPTSAHPSPWILKSYNDLSAMPSLSASTW